MREFFHPLVQEWFDAAFTAPTEPQTRGWPAIRAGGDVLISAPTGSGKTLAAFTLCLDDLVRRAPDGTLPDETLVVYVSPLKALTNDVRENLEKPLGATRRPLASERGVRAWRRSARPCAPATRRRRERQQHAAQAAARAGDDAGIALHSADRGEVARALRAASRRSSSTKSTRWRRQTRLASRADARAARSSGHAERRAETAAHRPLGDGAAARRTSRASSARRRDDRRRRHRREMELSVEVPNDELGPVASNEMWGEIYDRVAEQIRAQSHDADLRRRRAA